MFGFLAADGLRVARCTAPFTGGGAHLATVWTVSLAGVPGPLTNVVVEDNVSGLNCGGVSVIAGGHVQIARGAVRRNGASFLAGGALVMFGAMTVTDSVVESNS